MRRRPINIITSLALGAVLALPVMAQEVLPKG